jgi:cytochrome c
MSAWTHAPRPANIQCRVGIFDERKDQMINHLLCATALVLATGSALAQATDAGAKLAQEKNCMACHSVDTKIVGPAYKEVAKKYAAQKDAATMLAAKIIKGGSGTWGAMPMPPQAVNDAEAQQLVAWILKQK